MALDPVQVLPLLNIYETNNSQMLTTIYNYVIYTGNKKPDNDTNLKWMDEAVKQRNLVDVDWALANFNISNEPSLYQLGNNKLSNLKANTLIIWGDKDVTVPKIMFDETVRLLPEATVLVYENAGHSIIVDETEKLAIDIVHFIS
ncbi:alpha/beta hydrolase [Acholeplasma laidlawii]|uniref:alpha/beta fold hydrolase n=1 Tax=Acholeplasma laidlawii TaxID=2148 RepID=UPI0018C1E6E1|nr:alpha/beta hydrolase [Acholeplasma laidlawii]MBG0762412.1 alpha/beta hydrolase [Acholeplasma laidlawii]